MAHYLVRSFGPEAFDDLMRFRFPLEESDRKLVSKELDAFGGQGFFEFEDGDSFERMPNSPLPRDRGFERFLGMARGRFEDLDTLRETAKNELGIVWDWRCIGPFRAKGADPDAVVFPPEFEVDFAAEYKSASNLCRWSEPRDKPPVTRHRDGWIRFDYPYQDNTAIYAISHVTVKEAVDVLFHMRTDDDASLFLNDDLLGKYRNRGRNGSTWLWWRGPAGHVPDLISFPARLEKGRNKILVKIKNRAGAAGFVLSFTHANRRPVADWQDDNGPVEAADGASTTAAKYKRLLRHQFSSKSFFVKIQDRGRSLSGETQATRRDRYSSRRGLAKIHRATGFPERLAIQSHLDQAQDHQGPE